MTFQELYVIPVNGFSVFLMLGIHVMVFIFGMLCVVEYVKDNGAYKSKDTTGNTQLNEEGLMKISNLAMTIILLLVMSLVLFLLSTPLVWMILFGGLGFALGAGYIIWPKGRKFLNNDFSLPALSIGGKPKGYAAIKARIEKLEEMKKEIDGLVAKEEQNMSTEMKELSALLKKYTDVGEGTA